MNRLADEAMYFGAVADGVESQQEEIAELRQQLAAARSGLEAEQKVASQSENEAFKCSYKIAKRNTEVAELRQQLTAAQTEVADLKKQLYAALFEPVLMSDWQNLEQERDGLRQHVTLLRKGFTDILTDTCEKFPGQQMLQIMGICNDALTATEPITNACVLAARQNDGILLPFPYGDESTRRRNADDMGNPPANAAELLKAWKPKP